MNQYNKDIALRSMTKKWCKKSMQTKQYVQCTLFFGFVLMLRYE